MKIKQIIGFAFIVFGLIWGILDKYSCNSLCRVCVYLQLSPCYFLFLFVGVIFIISGVSLILTSDIRKREKKK